MNHVNYSPWAASPFGFMNSHMCSGGRFGFPQGFGGGLANAWMGHSASHFMGGWGCGNWGGHQGWGSQGYHNQFGHHGGHYGHPAASGHGHHHGCIGGHHHHQNAPREGEWNSAKGSYKVGQSGMLDVNVGQADAQFNNEIQYRVDGGPWQTIAHSKEDGKASTIHARPGSEVEFRINTPQGNSFQAGTTNNSDGIDHTKVNKTNGGYQLGFEDLAGAGGDFNDAIINLSDPGRRRP